MKKTLTAKHIQRGKNETNKRKTINNLPRREMIIAVIMFMTVL